MASAGGCTHPADSRARAPPARALAAVEILTPCAHVFECPMHASPRESGRVRVCERRARLFSGFSPPMPHPFLLPAAAALLVACVYGPLRKLTMTCLNRANVASTTVCVRTMRHLAAPRNDRRCLGGLAALVGFTLAGFLFFEVYFRSWECRVSDRWVRRRSAGRLSSVSPPQPLRVSCGPRRYRAEVIDVTFKTLHALEGVWGGHPHCHAVVDNRRPSAGPCRAVFGRRLLSRGITDCT